MINVRQDSDVSQEEDTWDNVSLVNVTDTLMTATQSQEFAGIAFTTPLATSVNFVLLVTMVTLDRVPLVTAKNVLVPSPILEISLRQTVSWS